MSEKRKNLIFLGLCFVLVFTIYSQSLSGDFVFDDRSIVEHHLFLKNLNKLPQIAVSPYWTVEAGLYRPVTLISYSLNYAFGGAKAWHFHLINLILYALSGYLLFLLIKKIFPERKSLAYLTPLLFLVLPIHTEAVANIVGRAEILALFFSLLVFWELIKLRPNPWKAGLWFLLALGSKEVAIAVLPISLWVIFGKNIAFKKAIFDKKNILEYFSSLLVMIASASTYLTVRFLVLGQQFFSNNATLVENPLKFAALNERLATALKILVIYLKKAFWPWQLCSDYSYNQISLVENFANSASFLGLLFLLFFAFSSVFFLKKAPVLALGSTFFIFAFLPVSNLIFPIGTIAGERLIYFPSVGLCLYLAQALISLGRLKPKKLFFFISIILIVALICFYAGRSFIRNFDWLNEENLFISAAQCAPNSVLSISNLATVYYFRGDYDRAEAEVLRANRIYDKYSRAINNLGLIYWKKGEYYKAKEEYFRAIKNWPPYSGVYENLVLLELSQGNKEQAQKWLKIFLAGN
jgi:protein O-mannosyl-transferase